MTSIRPAVVADVAAIARVQVATWRDTYRGIVPDAFLDAMREEEWAARRRGNLEAPGKTTFVAEEGGSVVGFGSAGTPRDGPAGFDVELYALYVVPGSQRRGLGRGLVRRLAGAQAGFGRLSLFLWVLRDNLKGRAFYEGLGGRVVDRKEMEIGGASLPEVALGWPDIGALLPPG